MDTVTALKYFNLDVISILLLFVYFIIWLAVRRPKPPLPPESPSQLAIREAEAIGLELFADSHGRIFVFEREQDLASLNPPGYRAINLSFSFSRLGYTGVKLCPYVAALAQTQLSEVLSDSDYTEEEISCLEKQLGAQLERGYLSCWVGYRSRQGTSPQKELIHNCARMLANKSYLVDMPYLGGLNIDSKQLWFIPRPKSIIRKILNQREIELDRLKADILQRTNDDLDKEGVALYIMTSSAYSKVGISSNPKNRLSQVQTGHPHKLSFKKVYWLKAREHAVLLEATIHQELTDRGFHTQGEWFNCDAEVAAVTAELKIKQLVKSEKIS